MRKFGAHLSIAGGYPKALERIKKIGGNCLQIFASSPRAWFVPKMDWLTQSQFLKLKHELAINPIYFHASYLINLADNGTIGKLSKLSIIRELKIASELKIKGTVVHLGSYKNQKTRSRYLVLINNIKHILNHTPSNSLLIIENAGNRKIGNQLEEISQIIKDVNDSRLRLCLDICHLFACGYRLNNELELETFLQTLKKLQLLPRLELWHLNDSRDPLGSFRDRHENIGHGKIGLQPFKILLNHPLTKDYPFIIETPGFEGKGPDKKNLDILKSLI